MKKLFLIRHAKSSWDAPLQDKDRPICNQGIKDAHLVSSKMVEYLSNTYTIWCSAAKRATETAVIMAQNISFPLENIDFKSNLYTFDESELEKIIKSCSDDVKNLIIFGHNGAITNFVNKFGDISIDNVPTSGFVSINFQTQNWSSISDGKTIKTIFPRDLK